MFCLGLNLSGNLRQLRIQLGQDIGRVMERIKLPHLRMNESGHKIKADCPAWITTVKSADLCRFDKLGCQHPGAEIGSADFLRQA